MITKEEFIKFINSFQTFEKAVERIENSISGRKYGISLFESDWYEAVGLMLDTFLESHFTENGMDWVSYWIFEEVDDKAAYINKEKDIFSEEREIKYPLNTIDELWDFLLTDIKGYFKNA